MPPRHSKQKPMYNGPHTGTKPIIMNEYLYLNSRDELYKIDITRIVFFEADGNYTGFTLCNGQKGSVCMNLAQMQKLIAENLSDSAATFARIGKRHIINMNYVFHISLLKQRLTLSDGASFAYDLDISKEALKKLKDIYTTSVRTLASSKK